MVLSWHHLQSMEIHWSIIVGTWKTCVPLIPYALSFDHLQSNIAGSGKSVLWSVPPCHFPAFPLSGTYMVIQCRNYSRCHEVARLWKCFRCIFLFRLQRHR